MKSASNLKECGVVQNGVARYQITVGSMECNKTDATRHPAKAYTNHQPTDMRNIGLCTTIVGMLPQLSSALLHYRSGAPPVIKCIKV